MVYVKGIIKENKVAQFASIADAVPHCVKHVSGGKLGIGYYDKIGHFVRDDNAIYFEAAMPAKACAKARVAFIKGDGSKTFDIVKHYMKTWQKGK